MAKIKLYLIRFTFQNVFAFTLLTVMTIPVFSQNAREFTNTAFLEKLNKDSSYTELKRKIVSQYQHSQPGHWGAFVNGVVEEISNPRKYVALTFDGCGGKNGNGYDKELIDFLRSEKIPATLFISGKWIDANFATFINLSRDTLFDIENHGLNHKPCSINGKSEYGIQGTKSAEEAFDEIEANARKIKSLTHYDPKFFRSSTTFIDEACVRMASELGIRVVSYKVLAGDAVPDAPASVIEGDVLGNIKPGAIVLMHLNHPEWNTFEAIKQIVPKLRQQGYIFVRLKDFQSVGGKGAFK
jgi:peptidoglycan/xylan/chitin deacetylase (PgdA/CDA1 family)